MIALSYGESFWLDQTLDNGNKLDFGVGTKVSNHRVSTSNQKSYVIIIEHNCKLRSDLWF